MNKRFTWAIIVFTILLVSCIALVFGINNWVTNSTKSQTYSNIFLIPENKTGLLLGTSKYVKRRQLNPYYQYRIDAAVLLYKAGKIHYIIVSGDNRSTHYNEPEVMKKDLVAAGVPANKIFLDYAGIHTLDSILRCKDIFGEDHITIISQAFHNERALFIANHKEIAAVGFNARDVSGPDGSYVLLREKFSRIKMMLELLLNTQPKYYYGNKIEVK
jgi:SanA protein